MQNATNVEAQFQAFAKEIDGTTWRATMRTMAGGICLRLEQRDAKHPRAVPTAVEFCRLTLAEAMDRARRHIVS